MNEAVVHPLAESAKRFLKSELKRADVGYVELAERLTAMGMKENKATIANKISRGMFSAIFMIAVLKAIGRESININDL